MGSQHTPSKKALYELIRQWHWAPPIRNYVALHIAPAYDLLDRYTPRNSGRLHQPLNRTTMLRTSSNSSRDPSYVLNISRLDPATKKEPCWR